MERSTIHVSTLSSAASLFFAALPAAAREERVFVLPLDGNGRVGMIQAIFHAVRRISETRAARSELRDKDESKRQLH